MSGVKEAMRSTRAALAALAAAGLLAAPAAAAPKAPSIAQVKCLRACVGQKTVSPGGLVRLRGDRFSRGMRAAFRVRGGARHTFPTGVKSRTLARVTVPKDAVAGPLYVRDRAGRRSNAVRPMRIAAPTLDPAPKPTPATAPATATGSAFDGNGMWIWYVSRRAAAIRRRSSTRPGRTASRPCSSRAPTGRPRGRSSRRARRRAEGRRPGRLRVAVRLRDAARPRGAGGRPVAQAGADCFVIDAETEYEGRYAQAQRYVTALRAAVGDAYPIGFTSFPYVDYHSSLPYSVFLGPGGAQYNAPQIYWKAIGGGVDAVVDHTYQHNRPYGRPIVPLGQLYDNPSAADVLRFRQLSPPRARPA